MPPGSESAHRALIEHPLNSALSTHVLPSAYGGFHEEEDAINLRDYWQVIVKRKWTVISFFLIVVIAVVTATYLTTPVFRATTVLQIEREAAKVVQYQDASATESGSVWDDKDFYQTQYELLKSKALALRVVEQLGMQRLQSSQKKQTPGLREWLSNMAGGGEQESAAGRKKASQDSVEQEKMNQAEALLGGLTVQPVGNSRLVNVSFDSIDPNLAATVANAFAQSFIALNLERRFDATSYAKSFLEERIAQVKAKLEDAEKKQLEYARDQQIFNVGKEGVTTSSQNMEEFNAALAEVQQERIKAESLYMQLKSSQSGELPQVLENGLIQKLKGDKAKLEADYQEKLKTFKPGYPAMQELSGQIAEVTAQLAVEKENVRNSIKASYEAAKAQEALISEKLAASKKEALDLQTRSIPYSILKREADTSRQLYEGLLQRLKEVSVAGGVGTNNVSVVDKAEVPDGPFKPSMSRNLMLAVFLGLLGGIGLAFFFEHLDDTFKQAADVEKQLHLAVLGIIPESKEMRKGAGAMQVAIDDPRSSLAEAYRSVRTALQFSREGGAPKLMAVTSSEMSEGKTTSALSLAIQFAQSGSRVLIIDADLRNPALHKTFGVDNGLGLTSHLAGGKQPAEITHNTPLANLYFMPSGPLPPNPAELLHSGKMIKLLELAVSKFDHIIIDSPPILGLADALVIANMVDAMLLVIEAGGTRRATVETALKRLTSVRVRPLGCLLTKMQKHGQGYGYEYYYSYGGKAGNGKQKLAV